jgi:hypothetical protein
MPPASTSPITTSTNRLGATSLTAMINTNVVTSPSLSSKDDFAQPISPMRMLLVDLLHTIRRSSSSCYTLLHLYSMSKAETRRESKLNYAREMPVYPCNLSPSISLRGMQTYPILKPWKRQSVNETETFATWKTTLVNDLQVLKQLRGPDEMSMMRHAMKEQDIGFHCYQAEENLTDDELALLKKVLLSELRWRAYKSKLPPGQA